MRALRARTAAFLRTISLDMPCRTTNCSGTRNPSLKNRQVLFCGGYTCGKATSVLTPIASNSVFASVTSSHGITALAISIVPGEGTQIPLSSCVIACLGSCLRFEEVDNFFRTQPSVNLATAFRLVEFFVHLWVFVLTF